MIVNYFFTAPLGAGFIVLTLQINVQIFPAVFSSHVDSTAFRMLFVRAGPDEMEIVAFTDVSRILVDELGNDVVGVAGVDFTLFGHVIFPFFELRDKLIDCQLAIAFARHFGFPLLWVVFVAFVATVQIISKVLSLVNRESERSYQQVINRPKLGLESE